MFTAVCDNELDELWTALLAIDKVSTKNLPLELGNLSHTAVSGDTTF